MDVLVICPGAVGTQMAAPGIRSLNIARVLKQQMPNSKVTLAIRASAACDLDPATVDFNVEQPSAQRMLQLVRSHDVIVASKLALRYVPVALDKKIVLDMYSPYYTEWLEMTVGEPGVKHRRAWLEAGRKNLMAQMAAADLILCANERQRDLIMGIMGTLGYVTPDAYDADPTLRRVIEIAPLGIRPHEPTPRAPIMKGVMAGIKETDFVLLWNGTIVEWYDLDVLIRAVHRLSQERDDIKLVFMGTEHPDSHGSKPLEGMGSGATRNAMRLCEDLGILDKHVFFNFGWANNEQTEQYLQEADAGVCTYRDCLETRYSFRVRFLDLFWASLPIVCTRGDMVSEWVERRELGVAVDEGDVEGLVAGIRRLADDAAFRQRCRDNLGVLREEFRWERTLAPLVEFCRAPEASALRRRREQVVPFVTRTADWVVSQTYYSTRWKTVGPWMRRRVRALRGIEHVPAPTKPRETGPRG